MRFASVSYGAGHLEVRQLLPLSWPRAHHRESSPPSRRATLLSDHRRLAWVILTLGVMVRLAYGVLVNDPLSGPDAPTYAQAAERVASHGAFADLRSYVANRHAGYPILAGMIYTVVGTHQRLFVAVQVLLVGGGLYAAFSLAAREFSNSIGLVALTLLCASPALIAASTEFMYEPLMGAGLVAGLDLLSRARHEVGRRALALAGGGGLLLGCASTLHPKVLAVAIPVAIWVAFRYHPRFVLAAACLLGVTVAPAALMVRERVATGQFRVSEQLGLTILRYNPMNDAAVPAKVCGPSTPSVSCSPAAAGSADVALLSKKVQDFWAPMVLPGKEGHGNWFHGLSVHRIAPGNIETARWFREAVGALQWLWNGVGGALFAVGAVLAVAHRRTREPTTVLFVFPVFAFLLVAVGTVAEPRFRLPVSPFYVPLQSLALAAVAAHLWSRITRRTAPAAMRNQS